VVRSGPALRARGILDRATRTLASFIAEEQGLAADDVEPWVIANALIGVRRALISYARRQALAGVANRRIAHNLLAQGERALAILEQGLG
jgi:hypothetical protein